MSGQTQAAIDITAAASVMQPHYRSLLVTSEPFEAVKRKLIAKIWELSRESGQLISGESVKTLEGTEEMRLSNGSVIVLQTPAARYNGGWFSTDQLNKLFAREAAEWRDGPDGYWQ